LILYKCITYSYIFDNYIFIIGNNRCGILRDIADNKEKESAFFGMCKMIEANPNAVIEVIIKWMNEGKKRFK